MIINRLLFILSILCACFRRINALSLTGNKTLIIYDSDSIEKLYGTDNSSVHMNKGVTSMNDDENELFKNNFKKFMLLLESNGYNYTLYDIQSSNNRNSNDIQLTKVDNSLYDNVIIFPILKASLKKGSSASENKSILSSKNLLSFFNNYNGNLMIITSPHINNADSLINLLNEFGIFPSPKNQIVKDLFQNKDTLLVSSSNLLNKYVYSVDNDTVYFNLGESSVARLDNREQLVPILKSSKTSFIDTTQDKNFEPWVTGSQGYLITGFQGVNNNARLVWVGSTNLIDESAHDINKNLVENLVNWNFNAKSVIKTLKSRHYHANTKLTYDELNYKINDVIRYEIDITEWDGSQWIPFTAEDIQFELRQVDPYYRINLTRILDNETNNNTFARYTTNNFKLPNRHGMFKFLTEYKRNGLSTIKDEDIKAIRHLAYDEYPRSWEITNSWVYLTANIVVISLFITFVILFLTNTNVTTVKKNN
ncbi:dolichyl-diphosphooligosaccharide-protein glycotransferase PWA37_005309 [Arxiozyma heterogenica]